MAGDERTDLEAPAAIDGTGRVGEASAPSAPPSGGDRRAADDASAGEAPGPLDRKASIVGRKRFNDLANENRSIGQLKRSDLEGARGAEPRAASIAAATAASDFAASASRTSADRARSRRRWLVVCLGSLGVLVLGVGAWMRSSGPAAVPVKAADGSPDVTTDPTSSMPATTGVPPTTAAPPTTVAPPTTAVAPTTTCVAPAIQPSIQVGLLSYRVIAKPGGGNGGGKGGGSGGGGGKPSTTVAPAPTPTPTTAPAPAPPAPAPTVAPPTTSAATPPPIAETPTTAAGDAPAAPGEAVPPPTDCS